MSGDSEEDISKIFQEGEWANLRYLSRSFDSFFGFRDILHPFSTFFSRNHP